MKTFNLEAAKAGAKVCTRDGKEVRILCFDRLWHDNTYGLVGLIKLDTSKELMMAWTRAGVTSDGVGQYDLFMYEEKFTRYLVYWCDHSYKVLSRSFENEESADNLIDSLQQDGVHRIQKLTVDI